jgi:large subunit ribosomal protein L24
MNKIRKGDEIIVITGKDKGKRGVVTHRTGANVAKKHVRPNPMKNTTGGIESKAMPIDQSNVAIFNPATQKADRVGVKTEQDGRKVRVFKSNGEPLPNPNVT